MEIRSLGRQLMVEYYDCSPELLNDIDYIRDAMLRAAYATGATIVDDVFHHFNPHGISGVVVIAESHLAIHTWPEYKYAAVDLFTCGDDVDPQAGFNVLKEAFCAQRFDINSALRGRRESIGIIHSHKPLAQVS